MDTKLDYLESEIIESREECLEEKKQRLALQKETLLLTAEVEHLKITLAEKDVTIKELKANIHTSQAMNADIARELDEALHAVDYWYSQHAPTITTIINQYKERITNACNHLKRFIPSLRAN